MHARGHRLSTGTPIFYVQKQKEKQGRKAQLGRVMHQRARGHEAEHSQSHFFMSKNKKKNKGERRNWREHARRCKRTRGRAQSLPFFILNNRKKLQSENHGFLRNIMRRYVRISSFFVQKCGEEKRNLRPIQGRTEILRLYFYFSGKIDWKIKDIFLKKENLNGLSTYIYGEKYCLTCKTVWVQFETVLRRQ